MGLQVWGPDPAGAGRESAGIQRADRITAPGSVAPLIAKVERPSGTMGEPKISDQLDSHLFGPRQPKRWAALPKRSTTSMNFLFGLHGLVAIVLLCSLLFLEEAEISLPFAPGELTLLAAGLLIAAGGLDPWIFVPLAFTVCVVGAMAGYSWARIVGEHGLTGIAVRFHQAKALERVSTRVRSAGPLGIAISRLIPGLRIYTTLVAGAFEVKRRTFLAALVPSTAIWIGVYVTLGVVAGIPVEHFLTKVARLVVQGAILLVIGVGGYLAIRRAPTKAREPLVNVPGWVKTILAALVDLGVVACILTGLLAVVRRATGPTSLPALG